MNKFYAGIGSRKTPIEVLPQIEKIGSFLARNSYALRSGGAKGADQNFEKGCDLFQGKKEIFHPDDLFFPLHTWATDLASEVCWEYPLEKMKGYNIKLITRNMYQVFGLESSFEERKPVDFVVYWSLGDPLMKGSESGGTRYAVRVANQYGIPTFNLRTEFKEFASLLREIKKSGTPSL